MPRPDQRPRRRVRRAAVVPSFSTIKVLLAAAFWRAVQPASCASRGLRLSALAVVGGAGVLHGFRHAAKLSFGDSPSHAGRERQRRHQHPGRLRGPDKVNELAASWVCRHALQRRMMDTQAAAEGRDNVTSAATWRRCSSARRGRSRRRRGRERGDSLALKEHRDGLPATCRPTPPTPASPATTSGGRYRHDCGVVAPGRALVLAVMTDGAAGYESMRRRGARCCEELAGRGRAASTGRRRRAASAHRAARRPGRRRRGGQPVAVTSRPRNGSSASSSKPSRST